MKITVVIPVRNEEESLPVLLDSLLGQTRRPDEIVITDGGSTDRTPQIIEEYIERGAPIRLVRAEMALPGRGRNLGAQCASSEWLAFTDGGMLVAPDWLAGLAERGERDDVDIVYGAVEPIIDTLFKECAAIAYVSPPKEINGKYHRPSSVASALIRRSVWQAVGGFPEHLRSAEDLLFMNKVSDAKFRTVFAPNAKVYWTPQPTFWLTFKRFFIYSRHNLKAGLARQWQARHLCAIRDNFHRWLAGAGVRVVMVACSYHRALAAGAYRPSDTLHTRNRSAYLPVRFEIRRE